MTRDKELNVKMLRITQRKKEQWKRHKQHEQGSTIELLTLNGLQKEMMVGQTYKRRIRRLYRRKKTAKATLRQINIVEWTILMANNLTNNIKSELEKNEPWRRTLSIRQHFSPASIFTKLRSNKQYKPGD